MRFKKHNDWVMEKLGTGACDVNTKLSIIQEQDASIMNFGSQNLKKIDPAGDMASGSVTTVIYDNNAISKIENLETYTSLQQLSLASNRIVRMAGLSKLLSLTVLNLPNNSIVTIEGLKPLINLQWLNLSGNSIKVIDHIQTNINLHHLDLSDNSISTISDISFLKNLKTLLLHGNIITSLKFVPSYLPNSVNILSLAENEINDLNEVMNLSSLSYLEQLSVMNNPCVTMTTAVHAYDYRPFVVNWCINLRVLDGYIITEKESLKAEWLFSQGKGRHFRCGQHIQLIQYLAGVCPLTTASQLTSEEDEKLIKILDKQRLHQQELIKQSSQDKIKSLPIDSTQKSSPKSSRGEETPQLYSIESPASLYAGSYDKPPVKAWSHRTQSEMESSLHMSGPQKSIAATDLEVQDVEGSDLAKGPSDTSLLDSDSVYLPVDTKSPEQQQARPQIIGDNSNPVSGRARSSSSGSASSRTSNSPSEAMLKSKTTAEDKPIKTFNQESRSRFAAKFMSATVAQTLAEENVSDSFLEESQEDIGDANRSRKRPATAPVVSSEGEEAETGASTNSNDRKPKSVRRSEESEELSEKGYKQTHPRLKTPVGAPSFSEMSPRINVEKHNKKPEFPPMQTGSFTVADSKLEHHPVLHTELNKLLKDESKKVKLKDIPDTESDKRQHSAACIIQSIWRGYLARCNDPRIIAVRMEIRAKRAEDHIQHLRQEVERNVLLYEEEKKLRVLQWEGVKFIWKEVQNLQKWKEEMCTSTSINGHGKNGKVNVSSIPLRERKSSGDKERKSSAERERKPSGDTVSQLTQMCANLQNQVYQMQETLSTVTNYVFQGTAATDSEDDPIRVVADLNETPDVKSKQKRDPDGWEGQSEPANSEIAENKAPFPGTPIPPAELVTYDRSETSFALEWQPSFCINSEGTESKRPVIGYRIYVNDLPKGMVASGRTRAVLGGMDPRLIYKIYVRAVSALGESFNSNVLMVSRKGGGVPHNNPPSPMLGSIRVRKLSWGDKIKAEINKSEHGGSTEKIPVAVDDESQNSPQHTPKIVRTHRRMRSSEKNTPDPKIVQQMDSDYESNKENTETPPEIKSPIKPRSNERGHSPKVLPPEVSTSVDVTSHVVAASDHKAATVESSIPLPNESQMTMLSSQDASESSSLTSSASILGETVLKSPFMDETQNLLENQGDGWKSESISSPKVVKDDSAIGTSSRSAVDDEFSTDASSPLSNRPVVHRRRERTRSASCSEDGGPSPDVTDVALPKSNSMDSMSRHPGSPTPSPSDALPSRASPKEQVLNKMQKPVAQTHIKNETHRSSESLTKELQARVNLHRSGSPKGSYLPDRYRISPTRDLVDEQGRVKLKLGLGSQKIDSALAAGVVIQSEQLPQMAEEPNKELSENPSAAVKRDRTKPVTVRRSTSLKAKLLLSNDPIDEANLRRTSSFRSRILPDKAPVGDMQHQTYAQNETVYTDGARATSPNAPRSPSQKHMVIIKGQETKADKQKSKLKQIDFLSKMKSNLKA
ncbi:uncharacterized protein LOC141898898 isoform X2 [Tubulanus polymorphus]|uniref:uncharacterized protein LOC141898898 isoform X2 n=1 Tax=Tubulanus polymorphus TaxID=672921 RepID=UPI003DA5C5AC